MDVWIRTERAVVGQTVNLHCHTNSSRYVSWEFQMDQYREFIILYNEIHWIRNRTQFNKVSKMLRITDVQYEDVGNYTCNTYTTDSRHNSYSTTFLEVLANNRAWTTPFYLPRTEEVALNWRNPAIWVIATAGLITVLMVLAGIIWFARRHLNLRLSERDRQPGAVSNEDYVMTDLLQENEPTNLNKSTNVSVNASDSSHSSDSDATDLFTLEPVGETCRGERVRSVCVVDDRLYVARFKQKNIEVYDTLTMGLTDKLMVGEGGHAVPTSLAADEAEKVIYIAYRSEKLLLKHNLNSKTNDGSNWPVDSNPESISVTSDHTIVVTFRRERKLAEYQPDGHLIRNIQLELDIVYPRWAISIVKNNFVICYGKLGKSRCGVCVVSSDGTIIPRVDTKTTCPCHLSLGPDRTLFVCDYNDGNVVMLDKNFQYFCKVVDKFSVVNQPFTSCLDSSHQLIYIGEVSGVQGDSRVMSFNVRSRPRVA